MIAMLLLVTGSTFAQTNWGVDKSHAKLGFGITHMMLAEVSGDFKVYDASITSTKDDFSDAVFEVSADIASINTENEGRDKDLVSEKYFNATAFPKLTFKSTSFKKVDGNKYKLTGDLTIKGITKPVDLDVTIAGPVTNPRGTKIGIKASGTFKRTDFGIGAAGGAMLSEEITLIANGEFAKK